MPDTDQVQLTRAGVNVIRAGVNVIRAIGGSGVIPWGARTLSDDSQWRYLSVRRLVCMVEEAITKGIQ